jgi:hypothetical protein
MNLSFGASTLQAAPGINMGCVIVIGEVSASVECFVCERGPTHGFSSASLGRRRPQSRRSRVCAAVQTSQSRVGLPRRGPTSEIRESTAPGRALGMRALVAAVRSHSVRPNYAFERTVRDQVPNARLHDRRATADWPRGLNAHRAAAQRER